MSSLLSSPLRLEAGPLNTARGSGERCKLPAVRSGTKPQPTNDLVPVGVKKYVQLWWQQFLLIFLRTNVIFCTKKPCLISYRGAYCGSHS